MIRFVMGWQQYRNNKQGNPSEVVGAKNRRAVREKIQKLSRHSQKGERRISSVSLPKFSRARLRHVAQQIKLSESEVLLKCLVLLVTRLKRRRGLLWQNQQNRLRLYNEDKYSYETVSVYVDKSLWLAMQARALELEVSLSYLADVALRLFLRQILKGWQASKQMTAQYWEKLLENFSYQKKQLRSHYGNPARGQGAAFSLLLDYRLANPNPFSGKPPT